VASRLYAPRSNVVNQSYLCSSAAFGATAGGAALASAGLAGVVALGAGAGVTGLAGSSGLQPLTIATHRPMLAKIAHALNPNVLVTMLLLWKGSDEQAHLKSEEATGVIPGAARHGTSAMDGLPYLYGRLF